MAKDPSIPTTKASKPLNRREFLYYLWGASMSLFMASGSGAIIWFALPRFKESEFGGVFIIPIDEAPPPDTPPKEFADGRFWLVHIGSKTILDSRQPGAYPLELGLRALYKVCTHLGCLYKWADSNDRFECPCHGSKFLMTGARIDGPARRNLDIFIMEATNEKGEVIARTEPSIGNREGTPLPISPDIVSLRIDTGRRIIGASNTRAGGGP